MKNKDKITLLKAKVIKLKEQLKKARLDLADKDNYLDKTLEQAREIIAKVKAPKPPIESTQELFEGKGYVYYYQGLEKWYAKGLDKLKIAWTTSIKEAKKYSSLKEFKNEYKYCYLDVKFEPIQ